MKFEDWSREQHNTQPLSRIDDVKYSLRVGNLVFFPNRVTNEESDVYEVFYSLSDCELELSFRQDWIELRQAEIAVLRSYIEWRKANDNL